MRITAKTRVNEAMALSKNIADVFRRYKLECAGCKGGENDTIEKVAVNNGLDLNAFIDDLNMAVKG